MNVQIGNGTERRRDVSSEYGTYCEATCLNSGASPHVHMWQRPGAAHECGTPTHSYVPDCCNIQGGLTTDLSINCFIRKKGSYFFSLEKVWKDAVKMNVLCVCVFAGHSEWHMVSGKHDRCGGQGQLRSLQRL